MARLDCSPTSPAGERMARIVTETTPWRPAPQALPAGRTVFALGDVHARAEHLWALQEQIAGIIAQEHDAPEVTVAWLGGYVDGGWQPCQTRSEERSVGKGWFTACRAGLLQDNTKETEHQDI